MLEVIFTFIANLDDLVAGMWGWCIEFASNFFRWVLDPAKWLEVAFDLFGKVLLAVSTLLPGPVASKVRAFGTFVGDVPIQEGCKVVFFFLSAVVHIDLLKACLGVTMLVWVVSMLLKCVFYIKGHIWSSSS